MPRLLLLGEIEAQHRTRLYYRTCITTSRDLRENSDQISVISGFRSMQPYVSDRGRDVTNGSGFGAFRSVPGAYMYLGLSSASAAENPWDASIALVIFGTTAYPIQREPTRWREPRF